MLSAPLPRGARPTTTIHPPTEKKTYCRSRVGLLKCAGGGGEGREHHHPHKLALRPRSYKGHGAYKRGRLTGAEAGQITIASQCSQVSLLLRDTEKICVDLAQGVTRIIRVFFLVTQRRLAWPPVQG